MWRPTATFFNEHNFINHGVFMSCSFSLRLTGRLIRRHMRLSSRSDDHIPRESSAHKFRTMGIAWRSAGRKPQINCYGETLCMVPDISPWCFQTLHIWRYNCSKLFNAWLFTLLRLRKISLVVWWVFRVHGVISSWSLQPVFLSLEDSSARMPIAIVRILWAGFVRYIFVTPNAKI